MCLVASPELHSSRAGERFFLPLSDDLAQTATAHWLIRPVVAGKDTLPNAVQRFLKANGSLHPAFEVAALFYRGVVCQAQYMVEWVNPDPDSLYVGEEYETAQCCARCTLLGGAVMPYGSQAIRRYCPPWHLYCRCSTISSEGGPAPWIAEPVEGDDQYLFNPLDLLSAFGLM